MAHLAESKSKLSPQAQAFQKEVTKAQKVFQKQQAQALKDVRKALSDYRYQILGSFAEVTEWDSYHVQQLKASLTIANRNAGKILSQNWVNQANEVTALALAGVDSPLKKIGLPVDHMGPFVPIKELAILNEYVPSLITQVADDVHKQVQGLMQQSLMGGITQRDMLAKVGNLVGPLKPGQRPPGTVFAKAHVRAKTILRTEMNRLHNLTTSARIDELAGKFPGVGKKWIHRPSNYPRPSHEALHGMMIFPDGSQGKYKTKFQLGSYRISGPHDPKLPAEHDVNCHCGLVVAYDSELGAKAAQDSPFIPGDGKGIPSAGMGPEPTADVAKMDKHGKVAHKKGLEASKGLTGDDAQKAYMGAFENSAMDSTVKGAYSYKDGLDKAGVFTTEEKWMKFHQYKVESFTKNGLLKFVAHDKKKFDAYAKLVKGSAEAAKWGEVGSLVEQIQVLSANGFKTSKAIAYDLEMLKGVSEKKLANWIKSAKLHIQGGQKWAVSQPKFLSALEKAQAKIRSGGVVDFELQTRYAAQEYWEGFGVDVMKGMPKTVQGAAKSYQGSAYRGWNMWLRTGDEQWVGSAAKAQIKRMDKAFAVPLPKPHIMWRGAGNNDLTEKVFGVSDPLDAVGKIIKDKGFCSTALNRSGAFGKDISFEILVPQGTKVCPMGFTNHFKSEFEFVLPRGTEFYVHAVEKKSGPGWHCILEVVK